MVLRILAGLIVASSVALTPSNQVLAEDPSVWRIGAAIARMEGWRDPHSLVRRLHNPGALVFAGQEAATRDKSGYARFADDAAGWRALFRDLERKRARGLDVDGIIRAWTSDAVARARYRQLFEQLDLLR